MEESVAICERPALCPLTKMTRFGCGRDRLGSGRSAQSACPATLRRDSVAMGQAGA
jgi:hypothetical protein